MTKLVPVAIASALVLAACGSVPTAPAGAAKQASLYCWKDRLATEGDALACNWEASAREACRSTYTTRVGREGIASGPVDAGRCDSGVWLVSVTTR
jgi:hypothetical protein